MDYRKLLKKYIEHVVDREGVDFLGEVRPDAFTLEEWKELVKISRVEEPLI